MINKQKNFYPTLLLLTYIIIIAITYLTFKDHGVHIEEKFHRLNGLFWLKYVSDLFGSEHLSVLTDLKINNISDYTLNKAGSYMDKYGVILDLPMAFFEIVFNIENIDNIYYLKQFISFVIFLISSFFFYKIISIRFYNPFLSYIGTILFISSPRIFGDSFLYKDVLFLSFFVITLYYFIKCLKNLSYKNLLFFSLFSAISFNLRLFGFIFPLAFFSLLILKNFKSSNTYNYIKFYLVYFFITLTFIFLLSPYLWTNTISNFIDIFKPLERASIGEEIKVLFNNEFVPNRNVPDSYLPIWIFISTPILSFLFFLFGYFFYLRRFLGRFINLKEEQIFDDLWRSSKEKIDFVNFFIFTTFFLSLIIFNSPFYNGWRLVYFLNIFIIYFAIYQIHNCFLYFRKKYLLKKILILIVFFAVGHNLKVLYSFHPYQSYYFTEVISNTKKNDFEIDYYGLSGKHFFLKIYSERKGIETKVAVASHTPLHRSLEGLTSEQRENFNVIGQNYNEADFIYKNNISEVNSKLNKKYDIPNNFVKIYELKMHGIKIYEIFEKKK